MQFGVDFYVLSILFEKLYFQGLRYAALFGAVGTTLGAWIKVLSVAPDRYWVTFVGHTLVALSQTFVLSVPSRLAAVWFGPDQVSSACSIGVFGNQVCHHSSLFLLYILFSFHRKKNPHEQTLRRCA